MIIIKSVSLLEIKVHLKEKTAKNIFSFLFFFTKKKICYAKKVEINIFSLEGVMLHWHNVSTLNIYRMNIK